VQEERNEVEYTYYRALPIPGTRPRSTSPNMAEVVGDERFPSDDNMETFSFPI